MTTHKINTHGTLTIKNNPLRDKPQHTPTLTPWAVGEGLRIINRNDVIAQIKNLRDKKGEYSRFQEMEANAEFIVRACNSHKELIENLRLAVMALKSGKCIEQTINGIETAIKNAEVKP